MAGRICRRLEGSGLGGHAPFSSLCAKPEQPLLGRFPIRTRILAFGVMGCVWGEHL